MSLTSVELKVIEEELFNIQLKLQTYLQGESQVKNEQSMAINSLSQARQHISNLSVLIE